MNDKATFRVIISLLIFFFISVIISACGPTYIIKNEYVPPTHPTASSCLQRCEVKKNSCQHSCNTTNLICKNNAAQKAINALPVRLSEYTHQLEIYTTERDRYHSEKRDREYDLKKLKMDYEVYRQKCDNNAFYCDRKKEIKDEIRDLEYSSIDSPERPKKPTVASETEKNQASCTTICGCTSLYDTCYTSCGGRIIPRQFCTHNCPDKK